MSGVMLENVVRKFETFTAVDDLNLEIAPGSFTTLLGPSGCGKTTTLRMIAGLEYNDAGRISMAGNVVSDASRGFFVPPEKRNIGMVFQSYAIWPHMTVFENVAYPLRARRVPQDLIPGLVEENLRLVEMQAYQNRPAPALSGGQQQRVAIARALVGKPQVLLMDEPLSNLDARLRVLMRAEIRSLQQHLKITTIYVTHDQEEAMAISDHVVVMGAGKILQQGAPRNIYRQPENHQVAAFFGSPSVLRARVVTSETLDGVSTVQVLGTGWTGSCLAHHEFNDGDEVDIIIRAEALRPVNNRDVSADDADQIMWNGTVREVIYCGSKYSVVLDVGMSTLTADIPPMFEPRVGEVMVLCAHKLDIWALPRLRA